MYETNPNFKLSFYPDCNNLKDHIDESIMFYDSKEFGKTPNYNELKDMKLKSNIKFVDYEINNKLYIKIDHNEITLEEIQNNPNFFDDEEIIYTKVVHAIFNKEKDNLLIEHIDLEYIFYNLEEYIERFEKDNHKQKGNSIKRQKVFKIDNAKINLKEELFNFVYYSLDNKTLVTEYFQTLDNP